MFRLDLFRLGSLERTVFLSRHIRSICTCTVEIFFSGFAEQSMKWNEIRNQQQQEKQQQKQLGEERQQQKKITPYMNNPYAPSTVGTTVTNISTTQRQYAPQTNINANYHMQDQGKETIYNIQHTIYLSSAKNKSCPSLLMVFLQTRPT